MIISASRRTDIPAFYSEWFINRLIAGYALVPNPRYPKNLSRVALNPEAVDCIVFWTKNPEEMLNRLKLIEEMGYSFYFTFTVTPYGRDIETNLPDKARLAEVFKRLSDLLGAERVDWRYDPVIFNDQFTLENHLEIFDNMCEELHKYTTRCIVSFVDHYRHLGSTFLSPKPEDIHTAAKTMAEIGRGYGLPLLSCAEAFDLSEYGIEHASCIDRAKIERITGRRIKARPAASQRQDCCCVESADIGIYNTCANGCMYCYATTSQKTLQRQLPTHDPHSPMLVGC